MAVAILVGLAKVDDSIADTVELEALDTLGVVGDAERLAESLGYILVNLVEDGKLLNQDLLLPAGRHVPSQVVDHAVLSTWLRSVDLLPQVSRVSMGLVQM